MYAYRQKYCQLILTVVDYISIKINTRAKHGYLFLKQIRKNFLINFIVLVNIIEKDMIEI